MAAVQTQTQSESSLWWRANRKSLPYIFAIPVLLFISNIIRLIQHEPFFQAFDADFVFGIIEFIWIPLFTWNLLYLVDWAGHRTTLRFWQMFLFKLAFCCIGVIMSTWMMEHIEARFGVVDDDDFLSFGTVKLSASMTNYVTNVFLGVFIAIPLFLLQERQRRLERNLEARRQEVQRLEKLQVQSRLEALQSKLNPHFLYNALNTLAGLVYSSPARAEQVILGLSELFRYSLQKDDRPLVTLAEEVEIVKTYLEIERIRFEGTLEYVLEVDDKLLNWKVPRFLLQPLVENAVKYGTSQVAQGRIRLKIHRPDEQQLAISIEDNGKPFPEDMILGFGLGSTMEKLSLLFPKKHEVHWANTPVKAVNILLKGEAHEPA